MEIDAQMNFAIHHLKNVFKQLLWDLFLTREEGWMTRKKDGKAKPKDSQQTAAQLAEPSMLRNGN